MSKTFAMIKKQMFKFLSYTALKFLYREPFEIKGLVPPRIESASLYFCLQPMLLVWKESHANVGVRGTA